LILHAHSHERQGSCLPNVNPKIRVEYAPLAIVGIHYFQSYRRLSLSKPGRIGNPPDFYRLKGKNRRGEVFAETIDHHNLETANASPVHAMEIELHKEEALLLIAPIIYTYELSIECPTVIS
jgi:hypothetical protein